MNPSDAPHPFLLDASDGDPYAVGAEHSADFARLRRLMRLGLALWLGLGIPNDVLVSRTFADVTLADLAVPRVASFLVLVACYLGLGGGDRPAPLSELRVRVSEIAAFVTANAAQGVFAVYNHGLSSVAVNFASCVVLAHGIALPRHWRAGALTRAATALAYPAALFTWGTITGRIDGQWEDVAVRTIFLQGQWLLFVTWLLVVAGGHASWHVRRQAFEARQVGRYQLKRKLGQGGMGEVWLAWHAGLKRDVALKLLRGLRVDEGSRRRFETEVAVLRRLTHPNTVRVYDQGAIEGGLWYFAMEYLDGQTLASLVDASGPLPPHRAVRLTLQAARGMAEVHRQAIVHRDLTPDNLLVTHVDGDDDFLKVLDFGLAHVGGAPHTLIEGLGSAWYAPPEQMDGRPVDVRADVYALGAVLYFLLTGRSPHEGPGGGDMARDLVEGRMDWPETIPDGLQPILRRCLAPLPDDRYPHAEALAQALRGVANELPKTAQR